MDPKWDDAVPPWRQPKTPQSASSSNIPIGASGSEGQLRQWATVRRGPNNDITHADKTSTPTRVPSGTRSVMRSSFSTPGLSKVGLGKFNIAALHELMQQPDTNNTKEHFDDFFPGGLGVPDSFQGLNPEENRPPAELFVWGQERAKTKRWDKIEPTHSHSPSASCSPTGSDSFAGGAHPTAGLPGIRRSAPAAAERPSTVAVGMKRKGPATAGGDAFSLGGHRVGGGGRRRASTKGRAQATARKSNYSAVRGSQGMWQFIARTKSVRETPVSRGDVFGLVREFEAAMAVMDNHAGGGSEGRDGAFMSPMQNDMHGLQQEVSRVFDARTAVVEAVELMDQGYAGGRGRTGNGDAGNARQGRRDMTDGSLLSERFDETSANDEGGSPFDLTRDWVKNAVSIAPEDWAAAQCTLGSCLFAQKWLDLTCGELTDQVTVMCLPHGQLLQELRRRNASVFDRLHGLYSDCLWTLNRCVASLLEGRRERKKAEEDWTRKLERTCADYEAKIKAIHDSRGSDEQEQARAKREAKAHVDRMGDTLRTLNGIFKTMQADGKAMTEVNLKDRCRSLEQELASRKQEMQELRRLKEKHLETEAEMEQVKLELKKTKLQGAQIKEEMERRQSLVKELMDNEAKRLTEIEALKAGTDRVSGGDVDDGEGSEDDDSGFEKASTKNRNRHSHRGTNGNPSRKSIGSKGHEKQGGEESTRAGSDDDYEEEQEVGSSVLCIKCRKALDDLSNIADALEKERQLKGQTRLQCHGYRLLLPNLEGYRPPRTVAWVRTVMRAILRAKIWDDSVLRYKQDLRARFPEFVYAWFEPKRAVMAAAGTNGRSRLVAEADDDRWGLYYGVKALAHESAEAAIFWHALNESNGEDYVTFLVYCLAIVEGTVGSMLRDQWGVSATCADLHTLKSLIEEARTAEVRSSTEGNGATWAGPEDGIPRAVKKLDEKERAEPLASGRDVVWLLSRDAVFAVNHILVKALEDQKRKVLDATQAISVSCEGRLPDTDPSATCVDLFLFLRILLHSFKEEQVNRRAAVRLMFETAATGVLTDGAPIYGDGRVDQSALKAAETVYNNLLNDSKAVVDLPQFLVIARTLWPEVTTLDAVTVFRDAHEETNGEVDYQAFLKLADRWQFFSNALELPVHMPSRADLGEQMGAVARSNLGALVHRHYSLMKPAIDAVKKTLPESAVKQLVKCQRAVERELDDASMVTEDSSDASLASKPREGASGSGGENGAEKPTSTALSTASIDGMRPLAAYRRLLAMLYHVRNVRHESGPGYETVHGKSTNVVQKTEAEFRALEIVFFDLRMDVRFQAYERIRKNLAAMKVQRTWRKILARVCEVPLDLLELMRPGYLRGVGGIASRAVHHPPYWVQQQIAEVYAAKLRTDSQIVRNGLPTRGKASGPAHRPLSWMAFDHLLRQWGTPELAERAAQDLYFNVRCLAPSLSRLRLFGAFSGCLVREESGPSFDDDVELQDEEALAFYLRAVETFHRVRDETAAAAAGISLMDDEDAAPVGGGVGNAGDVDDGRKRTLLGMGNSGSGIGGGDGSGTAALGGLDPDVTAMIGEGPKSIEELFPVTLQDSRTGRQYWQESATVAEAVAKELFDKCSQPPPVEKATVGVGGGGETPARVRVSGVQMSLGKLIGHPVMTGGREKRVDVDDALWLFMRHWLVVRQHRRSLVERALGQVVPVAVPPPSSPKSATTAADEVFAASPSPLASIDDFRVVTTRLEKLSRSGPPRGVSELVYNDAYLVALSLSRRREDKAMSHCESTKAALQSSPVLLWDVGGARREQQMPPAFSDRAMRSWLLSSWARYSEPVKAEIPVLLQELQSASNTPEVDGIVREPRGVENAAADGPTGGDDPVPANAPTVVKGLRGNFVKPTNAEAAKLVRSLERVRDEVDRLDDYMKDLEAFHQNNMAKPCANGFPSNAVVIPKNPSAQEEGLVEKTLSAEMVKKFSRHGEVERASKEMRSVMTILAAVYRRLRPNDPRDFVQDPWASGRRASLRRTSFNSY